ncbi:MAG: hypothetical protein U1F36_17140 [Planctomycetota bacterium]
MNSSPGPDTHAAAPASLAAWQKMRGAISDLSGLKYARDLSVSPDQFAALTDAIECYRPLIETAIAGINERKSALHDQRVREGNVEVYSDLQAIRPAGRGEYLTTGYFDFAPAGTPGQPEYVVSRVSIYEDSALFDADRDYFAARQGLAQVVKDILR